MTDKTQYAKSDNDKYIRMAAKFWHSVYKSNFYEKSGDTQRQWALAMKDLFNEVGTRRDP